jgi:hypothetical protein
LTVNNREPGTDEEIPALDPTGPGRIIRFHQLIVSRESAQVISHMITATHDTIGSI